MVTIVEDLLPEPQETFALVLSDPVGGELARGAATGRIDHEQEAPTAPVVTGVSGVSIGLGAYQVQRTITGEHFLESSVVTVAGIGSRLDAAQYVDATTIAVTLSGTAATTTGANDVTVTNRGRGVDLPITVVNPASAGWGQGTGRCLGITV